MRVAEMKGYEDTASVVSDAGSGGTGSVSGRGSVYGETREDLRELAVKLGHQFHEERFRVDRRKLEDMLVQDECENLETAELFFRKIQEETNALIIWPSRLKVGAKSKKDPNIRIAGLRSEVEEAKKLVIAVLDKSSNRVTMKLDVSYTDHSHIIGRKGETIQRVMKDTGCHIHFPDSNRNNTSEKSNQVSIAGQIEGVEAARESVRNLTPLIFSFELPIVGSFHSVPDSQTPELQRIQESYNVQVSFRTRPKLHATLVVVKGSEMELTRVKEATMIIIGVMCENLASQVLVQMTVEISPHHHSVVLGENSINLKMIMQGTGCQIMFPDAEDPNIPTIKKSNVNITGRIDNVYKARQMLLGSLPLILMFDLPEDLTADAEYIAVLMRTLGVSIMVRNKPKQSMMNVVVRGVERNASNIYAAHHKLLGWQGKPLRAVIPDTYHMPTLDVSFNQFLSVNTGHLGFYPPPSPMSPMWLPPVWGGSLPPMHPPHYSHLFPPQLMMHAFAPASCNSSVSSGFASRASGNQPNSYFISDTSDTRDHNLAYSSVSSIKSNLSSPSASPLNVSLIGHYSDPSLDYSKPVSDGYLTGSVDSLDTGCRTPQQPSAFSYSEYDEKKMQAARAKQEKPQAGLMREPTATWAGYGFSQSSPAVSASAFLKDKKEFDCWPPVSSAADPWQSTYSAPLFTLTDCDGANNAPGLGCSNILDNTPAMVLESIASAKADDITSFLTALGLEKYVYIFTSHEIDMATLAMLSESDLREVGVNALGARRKLLVAISELRRRNSPFSSSLAPGAERGSSGRAAKNSFTDSKIWQ